MQDLIDDDGDDDSDDDAAGDEDSDCLIIAGGNASSSTRDRKGNSRTGSYPLPPTTKPVKVKGKWQDWVLDLVAKQRKELATQREFSTQDVLDLRKAARKYKRAMAQRRYHKKRAVAAGTSHDKPGRPSGSTRA